MDDTPRVFGLGYLGATVPEEYLGHARMIQSARDEMIERRILRIEMAMRHAGIEVELIELPKVAR